MRETMFRGRVDGHWWYTTLNDDSDTTLWEQFWQAVDRKTVGQWTGREGRDQRKIYEGDLVRDHYATQKAERFFEVFWNEDRAGWDLRSAQGRRYWDYHCITPEWSELEIIGNIHEGFFVGGAPWISLS